MDSQVEDAVTLPTRSGLTIAVRRATPADEAAVRALFQAVSEDDRRFRFLSACDHVSDAQIAAMTHADPWTTDSFLAFVGEELVASGVLACDKAGEIGEVAIVLRSDRKAQGIGWALLTFLKEVAQKRGVKKLQSLESRENHEAIQIEREMGFVAHDVDGDPSVVMLESAF